MSVPFRCRSVLARVGAVWSALVLTVISLAAADAVPWHYPLALHRGGYWRHRVPVTVSNRGSADVAGWPVTVAVGTAPGELPLINVDATGLRVCQADGTELLFAVTGPEATRLERGPIPAGSRVTVPAAAEAGGTSTVYVYYDNPLAWGVPDFLPGVSGADLNGDLETGAGKLPAGWTEKEADGAHRNEWTRERPHSGARCVKTVVDKDAAPSWVAVVRAGLPVIPGAAYTIRAWVRASDVNGDSGWYVHVATPENSMAVNVTERAGSGSFDWRQVTLLFTAPADAHSMTIGTVLRGTGTAWFDDLSVESDREVPVTAKAEAPETLSLDAVGEDAPWPTPGKGGKPWVYRVPVRVMNPAEGPRSNVLAHVMLHPLLARTRGTPAMLLTLDGQSVPCTPVQSRLLFRCDLPPRTVATYYLYLRPGKGSADAGPAGYRQGSDIPSDQVYVTTQEEERPEGFVAILKGSANLVANSSFEEGGERPAHWDAAGEARTVSPDALCRTDGGLFGNHCVRIRLPHDAPLDWVGWRQDVAVTPGQSYFYAVWAKCRDIRNGTVQLHAHQCQADKSLSTESPYLSTGEPLSGDHDWTLWAGTTRMASDAVLLQLHLTMHATGTLWHDGALVAPILDAEAGAIESNPSLTSDTLSVWPVNPIVKVFQADPAPATPGPCRLELARNESEILQLALRSGRSRRLEVRVTPLRGDAGATLPPAEVRVVGYVPVDHPTSYYRSETPPWCRKVPATAGRCDGWSGWWPDPVIPHASLSLEPASTGALWLTVRAPAEAQPGHYRGEILLSEGGTTVRRLPLDVTVWDFSLPDDRHVAAIYDLRLNGQWTAGGKSPDEVRNELLEMLAARRLCPDRIHVVPQFRHQNGEITVDFAPYDAAASRYFDELHFPRSYFPHFFYCFGWGHPPKPLLGEAPYEGEFPYENVDRAELRPEYKAVYQQCLRLFWKHVKSKGWADRLVLYISDEPHFRHEYVQRQMKALCQMIHEVDPAIPIYSSTWRDCSSWHGSLNVWGVGHYGCFPVEMMQELQRAGDRIWFTTDGQMCLDTPFCAVERLLPYYCFKYGAEAYEFWGFTWLTYNPWEFGWHRYIPQSDRPGNHYYVRYPNGDGYLTYPGAAIGASRPVSSVRLDQAGEGAEDYEYLYLVRQLRGRVPPDSPAAHQADDALAAAAALIDIPNAGGRYSTRILPDPDAVPRLRRQLAEAILALGKALP